MKKLEKEVVVLTMIHEMVQNLGIIEELFRPSGITITMRGLIVFLEIAGYVEQAQTLNDTFLDYIGEDMLDIIIMDFSKEISTSYSNSVVTDVLRSAIQPVDEKFVANFITSFPHRRNELERAIRNSFAEKFVEITGSIKTMARYIRIDISRNVYNVTWNTVHDTQAFLDSIIKYKMATELTGQTSLPGKPFSIKIPELGLTLEANLVM